MSVIETNNQPIQNQAKSSLFARTLKRPTWMKNEGHWRVLLIVRLLLSLPLAIIGVIFIVDAFFSGLAGTFIDQIIIGLSFLLGSIAVFMAGYLLGWVVAWVRAGFAEAREKQ